MSFLESLEHKEGFTSKTGTRTMAVEYRKTIIPERNGRTGAPTIELQREHIKGER